MRRLTFPAVLVAAALLLSSCGDGATNKGSLPEGVDDTSSTGTADTPDTAEPSTPGATTKPSTPVKTPSAAKALVTVLPGNYASNPAVQGLVAKYPIYFQAQVSRDDTVVKETFPAYFYLDVTDTIKLAKTRGWVMRPPASIAVVGLTQRPHGVVRLDVCQSQRAQYWDPKAKKWARSAPKGLPVLIEMVETGRGWSMYHLLKADKPFSCANVRFPA